MLSQTLCATLCVSGHFSPSYIQDLPTAAEVGPIIGVFLIVSVASGLCILCRL